MAGTSLRVHAVMTIALNSSKMVCLPRICFIDQLCWQTVVNEMKKKKQPRCNYLCHVYVILMSTQFSESNWLVHWFALRHYLINREW